MQMKNRMPRLFAETVVKNALKSITESPERGIRNLIDFALQLSDGRFQKDFFMVAQTMLQNEDSAYYDLIRDVVTYVDTEKLYTFGINVGYNSCTVGAKRIRENEKVLGFHIPWTILLQIDAQKFEEKQQRYDDLIFQGEHLGIYTWMLFVSDLSAKTLSLIKRHPDSAFCVFCDMKDMTLSFLTEATMRKNMMIVIRYEENVADACAKLRSNKMLYSTWYPYGQNDTERIVNGDLFDRTQEFAPVFTCLIPEINCPKEVHQRIYTAVKQTRNDQSYSTIAWDLKGDVSLIDAIISDDACSVSFDKNGNVCDWEKTFDTGHRNLFESNLTDILCNTVPKQKAYG